MGGTQDNGTTEYAGSLAWNGLDPCGDGGYTAIDPIAPSTVYTACIQSEGVLRSFSGGAVGTWSLITNGLNTSERSNAFPPLVIDSANPQTLYFGTYRVYQTTNGANNWGVISPDLTRGGASASVITLAVAPSNSNTVYAGTSDGTLQVTTNAEAGANVSWVNVSAGLPPRYITQIAVDPVNSATAYVTFSGFSGFGDSLGHVFQTTNGGVNWTDISGNLPNIPVNDVVVDPNLPNSLYVATDMGVSSTTNAGGTWSTLMTGLPRVAVLSLKLYAPSRTLRAASHGRSAWDLAVPISAGLSIVPTELSYSSQAVGTTSFTQTVTFTNLSSSTALTLTSVTASGDFFQINNCGASLAQNASCTIQVGFAPTAPRTRTGTLTFTDSDSSGTQSVILTGTGTGGTTISLSPSSLTFTHQVVTITSGPQTVTLTNTGSATLEISSVTLGSTFGSTFAQTNDCGASVAAGASCTLQVTFTPPPGFNVPVPAGRYTGTLVIADTAAGSPQTVALAGTPTDFTIGLAGNSTGIATVRAGQTATYSLAFPGNTGFSGTVALSCIGAPQLSTCSVSPTSVAVNDTTIAQATLTVTTTARSMVLPQTMLRPPALGIPPLDVSAGAHQGVCNRLWLLALVLPAGVVGMALGGRKRAGTGGRVPIGLRLAWGLLFITMLATISLPSCGGDGGTPPGGGNPGTPAGTYTLDVKATYTSGTITLTHDIKLALTVN